jgi:YHS domain-containing protein
VGSFFNPTFYRTKEELMIDPVCGMEVNESSEFKSNEGGQTTYFCSSECKEKFEKNPNEFMNAA